MKKLLVFMYAIVLIFVISGMARADLILFEDFEDSCGLILDGAVPLYWGTAPLSGTASIPSQFQQGSSSQSGMIFYGSRAKEYSLSPAATMTIVLPDLSGYTNLKLTVALAAAEGVWEPTHRDSLHIIGGTTTSPPYVDCSGGAGCMPVTGAIDSFLPISYPDYLRSNVHSITLDHQFQDFEYTIDSSLASLTFAFASTGGDEEIGIDSERITGDPPDISGCIQQQGAPLIGVEVRLKQKHEDTQTTTTDSNGCYFFETINKQKDYTINAEGEIRDD
jgi:hypothetical protein